MYHYTCLNFKICSSEIFFFRGEDFRKDFKDLSVLKAFFPSVPTLALTATAPPHLLRDLKQSL